MTPKPGRQCTICASKDLALIIRALTGGETFENVASRFNVKKSALHRCAVNHQGRRTRPYSTGKGADRPQGLRSRKGSAAKSRSEPGRCSACGVAVDKPEPEMLLKRAERLMFHAEMIVERAAQDDDYRLQLQAIDRARQALELTMKAVGMLAPENLTIIDQRQTVNQFVNWPTASLKALTDFAAALESGATVAEAIHAISSPDSTKPQLALGRSDDGMVA